MKLSALKVSIICALVVVAAFSTVAWASQPSADSVTGSMGSINAAYPLVGPSQVWLEQKVVAADGQQLDDFGKSVAVSGDTALVGSYHASVDGRAKEGVVYVYAKSNGMWKKVQKLTASDGTTDSWFGDTVAIDGTTIVVGAPGTTINGNVFQGATYVFEKKNGKWVQTQKLSASIGTDHANFGDALALSGDSLVVGAFGANSFEGAVYVYTHTDLGWTATQRLTPFGPPESNGQFGTAVAIDGSTLFIGADQAAGYDGAVYVFENINNAWRPYQILTASDGGYSDSFGMSIALSDTTAIVGTQRNKAYVFEKSGSMWAETQTLKPDFPTASRFGAAVAMEGQTAVIGAMDTGLSGHSQEGAVFIFTQSGASWGQPLMVTASDRTGGGPLIGGGQLGSSVAISGTTIIAGALHATIAGVPLQGAAYFFGGANLGLALSTSERVNPGSDFSTSVIATNTASAISPAVAVSVAVPAAASFVSAIPTQGTCNHNSQRIRCEFGAIAGNAGTAEANITMKVLGQGGGFVNQRAQVIHATPPLSVTASSPINHLPMAHGGRLDVGQGASASGTLKVSDADGDPLVFTIVTQPQHGTVTINDNHKGVYTYTPNADYFGADSFAFMANDGYADSNVASVIIYVVNQPPVASDGTLTTQENTTAEGTLEATAPDGVTLTYRVVAPPGHGTLTLDAATGEFSYKPAADYFGADSFTFKASDGKVNSNVATVHITVEGSAPPPPPSDNGGGGSFGGLLLLMLGLLATTVTLLRRRRVLAPEEGKTQSQYARKDIVMDRKWIRIVAGSAMILLIILSAAPLAAQAHSAGSASQRAGVTGYRAGLAMPLPATSAPAQRVKLAPQSSLSLLKQASKLGPHASASTIKVIVGLKLRHVNKLKAFLRAVQNPRSPAFHKWLTPRQFTKLYGPRKAEVARVKAFLEGQGIKVTNVSPNRTLLHTEATTRAYENVLDIRINDYSLNGHTFYSTTDRPSLPHRIAPLVANILGLNNGLQMSPRSHWEPLAFNRKVIPHAAPPPSTAYFNPQQIAKAYDWPDITDPTNGAGVTIAIMTAETVGVGTNPNYHDFWEAFELPDHTVNAIPVGGQSTSNGGAMETALDIEWSAAMAPGADIDVYVSADAKLMSFTTAYNRIVTDNSAQVMTTSWGLAEAGAPALFKSDEQIFMQGAAQGISMFAAAGDNGAADCAPSPSYCPPGPNNADYPSSSQYITASNGTELSVSDLSGTYGSERASSQSGGAISQLFDKPVWQTGPGVPNNVSMRMNSDMALNYGGVHPYVVLVTTSQGTGFYGAGGTSAVAPILAGMFAIGVSQQPGNVSLGQSNSLIYNAVNANSTNYATDFHDVTEGCNGYLPDGTTLSCAGTDWDHPTGWGSPKATSLLSHFGVQGPAGLLEGTITNAASGATITSATVSVTGNGIDTSQASTTGQFKFALPVGDYTLAATAFGFNDVSTSVTINDGQTTTQDIALKAKSTATLSGKVTDGSGHGYGLYALITASTNDGEQIASTWTDPASGEYSIELPKGFDYTLNVTAAINGYQPATAAVSLSGDKTQNVTMKIGVTCTAPGYAKPFSEDFNTTWPPKGWSVTKSPEASPLIWKPNGKWNMDNWTGGTGFAADVGTTAPTYPGSPFDTSLITPPIGVESVKNNPILRYKANNQPPGIAAALDLDISGDGGDNWTNILHWTSKFCGSNQSLPGCKVEVDLGPYLPDSGDFQLRWHYYNAVEYTWIARYTQIDDVSVGSCEAIPGGLVFGQITDANTEDGITFASIMDDQGDTVESMANPRDASFPVGGYLMFVPAGERTLTVRNHHYLTSTSSFMMQEGANKVENFALKAGELSANPNAFALHVVVNNHVSKTLSIKNDGSGSAHVVLKSVNSAPPSEAAGHERGMSVVRLKGNFSPLHSALSPTHPERLEANLTTVPHLAPWQNMADYPLAVWDNGVARDPATHVIYSVDGVSSANEALDSVYAYNPSSDTWRLATHDLAAREAPQVAFIDGNLYVTGGLRPNGEMVRQLGIYDPATDSWTQGATIPAGYYGSATATVNGKLYVIGGCTLLNCGSTDVQVYDPGTNRWSKAENYPHPVSFSSCGGIEGKLYCAGGSSASGGSSEYYKDAWVYDPANDDWSPIPGLPLALWGSSYATADNTLLISGGAEGGTSITNAGFAYNPAVGSWYMLPSANSVLLRGGGVCGFYRIGGTKGGGSQGAVTNVEVLPGYAQCGHPAPVAWLTPAPESVTVAAGATNQVTLIFDGTGQTEFTTSQVYVQLQNDTPYPDQIVPLTVTWDPQPINLVLSGEVAPQQLPKGNQLMYTLTVTNKQAENHGSAKGTTLTYTLPDGVSYEAASGDATSCTEADGTVTCDFGMIALGDSKTETIAVQANVAGQLDGVFDVSAREPESDDSDNSLTLESVVIGTADLGLTAGTVSIPEGDTGSLTLTLENAGPDPASLVQIHVKVGGVAAYLKSAIASQGECDLSDGALACDLGQVDVGDSATVTLQLLGNSIGSATINAQASAASDEPDSANNGVATQVTVTKAKSTDNGGGGALGWLTLFALLGLTLPALTRHRRDV